MTTADVDGDRPAWQGPSTAPPADDPVESPARQVESAPAVAPANARDADPSEREAWALLLSVDGLGPAGFGALLAAHGSGRGILAAGRRRGAAAAFAAIAAAGDGRRPPFLEPVGEAIAALTSDPWPRLRVLRASGLQVVTLDDPAYPRRLRAIALPPPVILVRGAIAAVDARRTVAIVGTRRPTERGRLIAARIASAIARTGAVVISGLAVGIDGAAHAAVVSEDGRTVAVLGSGHDRLYPRAHVTLAEGIVETGGALVSELWPDRRPSTHTFPLRNRVISGLADATVVVEAGAKSGALITAKWALEQGRECFLVPGSLDEPRSAGCLQWLREFPGVTRIVAGIPELIEDLGLLRGGAGPAPDHDPTRPAEPVKPRRPSLAAELIELGPTAREIADALRGGRGSVDELVAATGHAPATVLGAITLLEMRGLATTTYGRYRAAGRLAGAPPDRPAKAPSAGRGRAASTRLRLPDRAGPC